jgi:hypothetical protein
MTSPDDLMGRQHVPDQAERLDQLRRSLLSRAPDPPLTEWEEASQERRNLRQAATGRWLPPVSELIVRIHGSGVQGSRLSVKAGTEILGELQLAVTGVGSAMTASKEAQPPGGLKKATQFDFTPAIAAGSIVFFLERQDTDAITGMPQDSFADLAIERLLDLLTVAGTAWVLFWGVMWPSGTRRSRSGRLPRGEKPSHIT